MTIGVETASPLSGVRMLACLLCGCLGMLVLGLQPLLFGGLAREGAIPTAWIGGLAAAERVTMALGSLAGLSLMRRLRGSRVAVLAALGMSITNFATIAGHTPTALLCLRGLAGFSEGILVSAALIAIGRDADPERRTAQFLALQTATQAAAAFGLPGLSFGGSVTQGGFVALAALGFLGLTFTRLVPHDVGDMSQFGPRRRVDTASWIALAATGLFMGALVCGWSFLGQALYYRGFDSSAQGAMMAACLAAQLPGVALAAYLAPRFPGISPIAGTWLLVALILQSLIAAGHSPAIIWICMFAYGFAWLFSLPFLTGVLIRLDPTRQSSMYLSSSILLGSALMPLVGAIVTSEGNVDTALALARNAAGISVLLIGLILPLIWRRREAGIPPAQK